MKFAMPFFLLLAMLMSTGAYAQKGKGNWRLFGGGKDTQEQKTTMADSISAIYADSLARLKAAQEAAAMTEEGHMAAPDTSSTGVAEIFQDYRIRQLLDKQVRINDSTGTITGFRVQLWFGSGAGSATKAKEVESEFLGMHPTVVTYRHYEKSAFRLKAGNFRTRMQAQKFHESIREYFPSAFIIQDQIQLPELPK